MLIYVLWGLGGMLMLVIPCMTLAAGRELQEGDAAPDFNLPGSDGKTYHLADFKGKKAVVLAWFPKAFTPGCTNECKAFAAGGRELRKFNAAYFTISCDTAEKNKSFAESVGADYPILADADRTAAEAYGVIGGERKNPWRWTFYIGADGKILYIDKNVSASTHAADVAAKLKELGIAAK